MKRLTNREAIEKIFKTLTIVSTENKTNVRIDSTFRLPQKYGNNPKELKATQ